LDNLRAAQADFGTKTDGCKLFCYVILTTPDFANRSAHLNNPERDSEIIRYLIG
jgi:hypothetical protein